MPRRMKRSDRNVDHIDRFEFAGDTDRQAFMGELVEHVEHPILASVMGAVLDEVVGPDMITLLRAQPNARSVGQPESADVIHSASRSAESATNRREAPDFEVPPPPMPGRSPSGSRTAPLSLRSTR